MSEIVRLDRFLGGRLTIAQSAHGFRAGHDTVLVAAAVPAQSGERVLELGAGAGVASLCLAARVPGVHVLGIEIDPDEVALANQNAARNAMGTRVRFEEGDATAAENVLTLRRSHSDRLEGFNHVFFNPPFYPTSGQQSPNPARARAMHDTGNALAQWTKTALALTRPAGTVTAILPANRVGDMLATGQGAVCFPLFPHAGEPPKRMIVQIVKGSTTALRATMGLVLHQGDGRNTQGAEAVLRHGEELRLD